MTTNEINQLNEITKDLEARKAFLALPNEQKEKIIGRFWLKSDQRFAEHMIQILENTKKSIEARAI